MFMNEQITLFPVPRTKHSCLQPNGGLGSVSEDTSGRQRPVAERAQAWCQRCGRSRYGRAFGPTWIRGTACVCAQSPRIGTVQGSYGPRGELFLFLPKKEPMVLSELVEFGSCISAETVKACALIGLHMTAEENAVWSDRDSSPE